MRAAKMASAILLLLLASSCVVLPACAQLAQTHRLLHETPDTRPEPSEAHGLGSPLLSGNADNDSMEVFSFNQRAAGLSSASGVVPLEVEEITLDAAAGSGTGNTSDISAADWPEHDADSITGDSDADAATDIDGSAAAARKLASHRRRLLAVNGDMPVNCPRYSPTLAGKKCSPSPASASKAPVYCGSGGRLAYTKTARGNRLMDFSYAGYCGGGVAWPRPPARVTVRPSGGDDRLAIQQAIWKVSALPPDPRGMRGAVQLSAGTFKVSKPFTIKASGVVIRGAGRKAIGGTTIQYIGTAPSSLFIILGDGTYQRGKSTYTVTDKIVPSGARTLHVGTVTGLRANMPVLIERPITAKWIKFMGMDALPSRNGVKQNWITPGSKETIDRVIVAVDATAKTVTLDAPIADKMDMAYISPDRITLTPYTFPGRINNVGIENLRAFTPFIKGDIYAKRVRFARISGATDIWINQVEGTNFVDFAVLQPDAKRVTIQDPLMLMTAEVDIAKGLPIELTLLGTQALVVRPRSNARQFIHVATFTLVPGPNVVVDFKSDNKFGIIEPHQRWATGMLVDGGQLTSEGVRMGNRYRFGTGQGWSMGFGAVYNAKLAYSGVQTPPGSDNWAIGCTGYYNETRAQPGPAGTYYSKGKAIWPASLYREQLRERRGEAAVTALNPRL